MKSNLKLLSILAFIAIAYSFVGPGSANAQLQWTIVSPPPTNYNIHSITYGNGQYMAVGDKGMILTSLDGLAWTSQASGTSNQLNSVIFSNGQFVAVGFGGTVLTSPDGLAWTSRSSGTGYNLNSIAYGNGGYVAVGDNKTIIISQDGINWSVSYYGSGGGEAFRSVTYGNGQYWASSITWSSSCNGISGYYVCYQYVEIVCGTYSVSFGIIGWAVVSGKPTSLLTYQDNTCSCNRPLISLSLSYCNGQQIPLEDSLNSVTYASGQYVEVGNNGIVNTSPNDTMWTSLPSITSNNLNSVTSNGNGQFIAVGNSGTILISSATAVKPGQTTPMLSSVLTVQTRNSLLTISLPSAMLGKSVDLAVYSVSGQEIMRKRVNTAAGRFTLPVSFSYGSYILVANDGSRKSSVRFVAVR